MPVILINPFEVDPGDGDEFVRSWRTAAEYMKRQPGFIAARLHRALGPNARFQFVNIAQWESPQHFMSAIQTAEFKGLSQGSPPNFPGLYQVVETEGHEVASSQLHPSAETPEGAARS